MLDEPQYQLGNVSRMLILFFVSFPSFLARRICVHHMPNDRSNSSLLFCNGILSFCPIHSFSSLYLSLNESCLSQYQNSISLNLFVLSLFNFPFRFSKRLLEHHSPKCFSIGSLLLSDGILLFF